MGPTEASATSSGDSDLGPALDEVARTLNKRKKFRAGQVVFDTGESGAVHLDASDAEVSVRQGRPTRRRGPRVEVLGKPAVIRSILDGDVDARARFFAGGLRVRGDLRYLSEVAMELGWLKNRI